MAAATAAVTAQGIDTDVEEATTCCYAVQDKVWVDGPDGARWEVYTVLGDAPGPEGLGGDERCCTPDLATVGATAESSPAPSSSCC